MMGELANMVYAPDWNSGYPGSLPGFSTMPRSVARMVRAPPAKRMCTSSNLVLTSFLFSCGTTAAYLILVQQIVVQIHAGKQDVFKKQLLLFWPLTDKVIAGKGRYGY
jgi:hypothetical protein